MSSVIESLLAPLGALQPRPRAQGVSRLAAPKKARSAFGAATARSRAQPRSGEHGEDGLA